MKKIKKLILGVVAVVVVAVGIYLAYYLTRYTFNRDYKQYIKSFDEFETGKDFAKLTDSSPVAGLEDYVLAAENDGFKLYVNEQSCVVALYNKKTGQLHSTNPLTISENMADEGTNSQLNYNNLQSQLILTYYMKGNPNYLTTFNSYEMCVGIELNEGEDPHYTFQSLENGLRVIYTVGDTSSETGMVPKYLTQEKYDELLARMEEVSKSHRRTFSGKYRESSTKKGYLELLESNINPYTINKMEGCLEAIGYTFDDYKADMELAGAEVIEPVSITVPLDYHLTEDGLKVNVATKQIKETGGAMLYELSVLPFFNAEKKDGEDGYFLVPSGSGAIINFNNGLMASNSKYQEYIYGQDPLNTERTQEDIVEDAKLPLYGFQKENSTMLVTLDDGESYARLNVTVSDVLNFYNYAYVTYNLRNKEEVTVAGSADPMPVLEPNLYEAYLTQTYHVLPDEESYDGYSGMAKYYRELLFGNDEAAITNQPEDIKLYVDILNAVARESSIAGFKYNEIYAMTTFGEAKSIAEQLYEAHIGQLVMNLQGWMNDGYYHEAPDNIKVIRKLGGKSDLAELTKYLEGKNGTVYGDVAIQNVSLFDDDFKYTAEGARYYGKGFVVSFGKLSPTTYGKSASLGYRENMYTVLSSKFLPHYVESLLKEVEDIEISGISYRDLGNVLYSDKKRKEFISREMSKNIILGMLEKAEASDKKVMLNNALGYAIPFAQDILNVPFFKNSYVYIDGEVPFYEMVIHGYVDYCGKAYNLNKNVSVAEECLELIENGAAPHFTFTWEPSSELKYTALNNYFSTEFSVWKDTAVSMYQKVNEVLSIVSNATMDRHEITEVGATVTYSNGAVFVIDKTNNTVTVQYNGATSTYEFE